MQEAQKHKHIAQNRISLGVDGSDGSYVDIEFVLSGDEARCLIIRLLFMPPSDDPAAAETLYEMVGDDIACRLSVQVVSFYDRKVETEPAVDGNPFGKPEGQFDLFLDELNYLYKTVVEIIFRVADTEQVELIFFGADNERLKSVYDRYIRRFARDMKFDYINKGAYYAIRTQHYPREG